MSTITESVDQNIESAIVAIQARIDELAPFVTEHKGLIKRRDALRKAKGPKPSPEKRDKAPSGPTAVERFVSVVERVPGAQIAQIMREAEIPENRIYQVAKLAHDRKLVRRRQKNYYIIKQGE